MRMTTEHSLLARTRLLAEKKLFEKYSIDDKQFRIQIVNEILFNENTHLVTRIKDYLIWDDNNKIFNRFYESKEIEVVLPFILEYYINYPKINPTFILNKEGNILYKNSHRKQKLYLSKHTIKEEENELSKRNSNILLSECLKTFFKHDNLVSADFKKIIQYFLI